MIKKNIAGVNLSTDCLAICFAFVTGMSRFDEIRIASIQKLHNIKRSPDFELPPDELKRIGYLENRSAPYKVGEAPQPDHRLNHLILVLSTGHSRHSIGFRKHLNSGVWYVLDTATACSKTVSEIPLESFSDLDAGVKQVIARYEKMALASGRPLETIRYITYKRLECIDN